MDWVLLLTQNYIDSFALSNINLLKLQITLTFWISVILPRLWCGRTNQFERKLFDSMLFIQKRFFQTIISKSARTRGFPERYRIRGDMTERANELVKAILAR